MKPEKNFLPELTRVPQNMVEGGSRFPKISGALQRVEKMERMEKQHHMANHTQTKLPMIHTTRVRAPVIVENKMVLGNQGLGQIPYDDKATAQRAFGNAPPLHLYQPKRPVDELANRPKRPRTGARRNTTFTRPPLRYNYFQNPWN